MTTPTKFRVHLICNAHLDPVWQWRWTEGCSEAIATFKTAVELLQEYPELIFNHNEAILYEWVLRYDPKLFKKIQDLVARGRWFIAGGWFLQPDVNLPTSRNLIRHIQLGKEFFKKHFQVEPKVAYNFDSFGHSSGLPKLLREHGYEFYVHQRPEKEVLDLPDSLYVWEGSDGTRIPAYRIEIGLYHTERNNIRQRLNEGAELALKLNRDVAVFWGLGNHGGGATREDLAQIRDFIQKESRVEFIHSTTDGFYQALTPYLQNAPVFQGELQRVFAGTYTSLARLKRKAVQASGAAQQMEDFASWAPVRLSKSAQKEQDRVKKQIWKDILFNDFHDILTGSCTQSAEEDAMDLFGRALEQIREVNMDLISRSNLASPPVKAHIPVSIFQGFEGLKTMPVEFECMSDYRPFWEEEKVLTLTDSKGQSIPCQEEAPEALLPFHRWRRKVVFMARNLDPGVHHFGLNPVPADSLISKEVPLWKEGPGIQFRVVEDLADSWGTDTWKWDARLGDFEEVKEHTQFVEQGPVRIIQERFLFYGKSQIVLREIQYPEWPVREYRIRINWHEERKRLKLIIPLKKDQLTCKCEIPGGVISRNADGQEHSHGSWMELPASTGGIALAHNGLHGYDLVPGELRLSVLRSAAYCHWHAFPIDGTNPRYMDQGMHEVRLALWNMEAGAPEARDVSAWLNAPPLVYPHLPIG